ncbi:MAG: type II secretion system major pseudopilin GspG [Armatimonadetes bacterium]|nr:type II secretion system major pseudopilin GspG [Armatimonadota bacterium]
MRSRRRHAALTLIELLVVMVILVILAGSITFYVANKADQARVSRAKSDLQTLSTALEAYNNAMAEFPTTEQGLKALFAPEGLDSDKQAKWRAGGGPFLQRKNFNDPWGHEYQYVCPGPDGHDYDIRCVGADGKAGGTSAKDQDISVWDLDGAKK